MNPMLKDPAAGVPPQLLPHLHLVSKYRYPITSNPSLETIVGYLLEAPKIVRDIQPMQWQFVDTPADGTLMLTWQPLEYLGTNYASDGFIWADAEHVFKSEVRGYTLEMFLQRSGYRAQGEQVACHSRRRYRLLPGNPNLGLPNPDPSLWLIHYSKASGRDHVPAASIPIMPHVHAQIQQRRMIQAQGQLPRKEFMLHDRSSWPTIHPPPGLPRPGPPGPVPPGASHRRGPSVALDAALEEEDEVSHGDLLDFMTPRDISRMRYEQHHEWMEEVIESPYPTVSIIPSDLGLGRKGQLEELTKDFFDAPTSGNRAPTNGVPPRVGRLPAGQSDEFAKRAAAKLAEMQAELEHMRRRHARRMEKLQRSTILTVAEKKLRAAPNVTDRPGHSNDLPDTGSSAQSHDAVDEIVRSVEAEMGQKLTKTTAVTMVSKGGLEQRAKPAPVVAPPPAPAPATASPQKIPSPPVAEASSSLPQSQQPAVPPTISQPEVKEVLDPLNGQPVNTTTTTTTTTTTSANMAADAQATPSEPQEQPISDSTQQSKASGDQEDNVSKPDLVGDDVNMDGVDGNDEEDTGNQDGNDWVMIGEESGQSSEGMDLPDLPNEDQALPDPGIGGADAAPSGDQTATPDVPPPAQVQAPTQPQPQPPVEAPLSHDTGLDTPDFDMGGDFDNVDVDTAGDALASYGNDDDDLNLDPLEDSAFGDAFHPEEDEDMA